MDKIDIHNREADYLKAKDTLKNNKKIKEEKYNFNIILFSICYKK